MNENAKLWVKELRETEIPRCNGNLCAYKNDIKHCCALGILVDLFLRHHPDELDLKFIRTRPGGGYYEYDGYHAELPPVVCRWAGLSTGIGEFEVTSELAGFFGIEDEGPGAETSVAGLNDAGLRFKDIADIIELEPPGLFIGA